MRDIFISLLVLAAAGCATAPSAGGAPRAALPLSHWTPPKGQTCEVIRQPAVLPTPAELADTTALAAAVRQIAVGLSHVLVSLRYDSAGILTRLRVIEPALSDTGRDAIEQAIAPTLLNRAEAPAFTVRLLVQPTATPRFQTGYSGRCLPSPRAATHDYLGPPPGGSSDRVVGKEVLMLRWNVLVDQAGRVVEMSRIGSDNLPAELLQSYEANLRETPWNPGLDDGVPVPMRTTYTARVEIVKAIRRIG